VKGFAVPSLLLFDLNEFEDQEERYLRSPKIDTFVQIFLSVNGIYLCSWCLRMFYSLH
jgi:hypothetical protein